MSGRILIAAAAAAIGSLAGLAVAADVSWVGGTSDDATLGANWDTTEVPDSGDRALFRTGANGTADLGASNVTWDQLTFNSGGATSINGTGTMTLNGVGGLPVFSGGGPLLSTINPNISTIGSIQSNGQHDLTLNGDVTAGKIEAFSSTSIYNGNVTASNDFITGNGKIVFNGGFHWAHAQAEMGINGGGTDVTFTTLSSDFNPSGVFIINLFDGATVRNGANNAIGTETDLFARHPGATYNLDGFNDGVEFLGTNGGINLDIDFGPSGIANTLIWQASHHLNGTYVVENFEIGSDALQLGAAGPQFFDESQLAQITINGVAYSATDPANGSAYWNRNANLFVELHNVVPEPSSVLLVCVGLIGSPLTMGRRINRATRDSRRL